jgi:hypothetical protein
VVEEALDALDPGRYPWRRSLSLWVDALIVLEEAA